jgi:hypothetical protein
MQRRYALLILVCRIKLAAVEQLLYSANLAQPRQLHNVLLYGQAGCLVRHIIQLMFADRVPVGFGLSGCGSHLVS